MRAMSPVTVDYPHSMSNDMVPLTTASGTGRPLSPPDTQLSFQQRNVAIEDPYSNQPVLFSMVDVNQQSTRYTTRQDIPMQGMNNSSYANEESYAYDQTTAPHKIRRPSWERGTDVQPSSSQSGQPGDQMVQDWLWQSPDRRA
jgi:hypothetical protein